MNITIEKAVEAEAEAIFSIQLAAFQPLLEKYQDEATNPANESIDRVITRINLPDGGFYKILADGKLAGAICVFWREGTQFWISPMFIHPKYQGHGIAQEAIRLIETRFPEAVSWELSTISQEDRNIHLYEKMGYQQTGKTKALNERAMLVYFKKVSR